MMGNQHRTQIYYGGSGSGKSVSLAQRCVLDLLEGNRNYLVLRKVQSTVQKSVKNEILGVISDWNILHLFHVREWDITCKLNNRQAFFGGMDDPEKVKGIKFKRGVLTDVWYEESTESNKSDIKQLNKRLRGISSVKKRLTMSFNPIEKTHWIYKEYFKGFWVDGKQFQTTDSLSILKTTYKDNAYLMPDDIAELENEPDKYWYEVYTLGNWGSPNYEGKVFSGFSDSNIVEELPKIDSRGYMYIFGGYDRGFTHRMGAVSIGVTYDYKIHVLMAGGYARLEIDDPDKSKETILTRINKLQKLHCLYCSHEANEHISIFKREARAGRLNIESIRTWLTGFSKKNTDTKLNDKTKTNERLEFLNFLFIHDIIYIPHEFKDLIEEIQGLEYKKLPDDTYDRTEVMRVQDDIIDALSFACGGSRNIRREIIGRIKKRSKEK